MDNFFAKKGLTLSRNNNANAAKNADYLLRSNQQNIRTQTHHIGTSQKHSLEKYTPIENTNNKTTNNNQPNYQSLIVQRQQKSLSVGPSIRLMAQKDGVDSHPPLPKQTQWKYVPNFQGKQKNQTKQQFQLNTLSSNDPVNKSFQQNSFIVERLSQAEYCNTQSDVKSLNKSKFTLQPYRTESQSPGKIIKASQYLYTSPVKSRENSQSQRKINNFYGESNSNQKILNDRISRLQKQKDDLLVQLRKKDGKYVPQEWFEQKYKLIKQINQKTTNIRQLQSKISNHQKQTKMKTNSLEFEIRMLQGSKSRLQSQNDKISKLYQSQRAKNDKAKEQINKLIFFQDDLIHAKDYNHLKEELEEVLTQNAKMFQQHQKYIIEVGETRRQLGNKLEQLEEELNKLRKEYHSYKLTIQRLQQNGDDKMLLIKLQNENNFLRKKNEQSIQTIISKQKQIEEVRIAMKQMTIKQNQQDETNQKFIQQMNMWQIKDTIAMYQARIQDLNQIIVSKNLQMEEQKKEIDFLSTQVRNYKEDKHINNIKQKSHQNSLKNQVETLQRTLQMEIELKNKKIVNLQEFLQRKSKQINEKDKFIKTFLITRVKQLESSSIDTILRELKDYLGSTELQQNIQGR